MQDTTKKKLIAGNWKMNGSTAANAALLDALLAGLGEPECDVAVCVPSPYLAQASARLASSGIAMGAQDVSAHPSGAYTGEVAATMLRDFHVRYVLVGHSERRLHHAESDAAVAGKALAAVGAGLVPIVCVGETLAQREAGETEAVVGAQLAAVLEALGDTAAPIVLAYEPVWAIGTGRTATPAQAQSVHASLRRQVQQALGGAGDVRILYGGSMNAANAAELLKQPDIDGGLIGGASLKAADFLTIIAAGSAPAPRK